MTHEANNARAVKAMETLSNGNAINVGLLFHSVDSGNFGVGALTLGNVAIAQQIADQLGISITFRNLTGYDEGDQSREPYLTAPNVSTVRLRTRSAIGPQGQRTIRDCDLVLDIGGGDSFTDIYGMKRFLYLVVSKLAVIRAKRPLILSPQTIGPFRRKWTKPVATWLMNRCRVVVARDGLSRSVTQELGVRSPVIEAIDVAFRLPYQKPAPRENGSKVRVGINVSGLLFHRGCAQDNMFGLTLDYPLTMRETIQRFVGNQRCEVHLISHVLTETGSVEDDYGVCRLLAEEFPGCTVAPRFHDPSEAKSYIATLDYFCGARMHACLAAFSTGVPLAPLAYSRKATGLFHSLDYPLVVDGTTETTAEAVDRTLAGFEQREELARIIAVGNRKANDKLVAYEDLLREVFAAAVEGKS